METVFILVKPENPANVGASCRALKTMGHGSLRLVDPQCEYMNDRGRGMAHGSEDLLNDALVFSSLEEASRDIDFLVGTTARHRQLKLHYVPSDDLSTHIESKKEMLSKVGIVFGGERSGLSNEDLFLCDMVTTIPTATKFPSLNLSQSVMLFSYLLRTKEAVVQTKDWREGEKTPKLSDYRSLKSTLVQLIDELDLRDNQRLQAFVKERLSRLSYEDLHLVHSLRNHVKHKIDSLKSVQGHP